MEIFAKTKSGQYHKYFYIPSGAELLERLQLVFNSTSCSSIIFFGVILRILRTTYARIRNPLVTEGCV
jgi:hypothetical protein